MRAVLLTALTLSACTGDTYEVWGWLPVEGDLSAEQTTLEVPFEVDIAPDALVRKPEKRSAQLELSCDYTAYLGVCDDCRPEVTAELLADDGAVLAGQTVTLEPGRTDSSFVFDPSLAGDCERRDEDCVRAFSARVSLDREGYVRALCDVSAVVQVPEDLGGDMRRGATVEIRPR